MKKHTVLNDIPVIGMHVKTFPEGIKDAFDQLMKILGVERDYYGISWMDDDNNIVYYAMAKENFPNEATQHNLEKLTIAKGDYKTIAINDWMSKTALIKDVFHDLMGNKKPDKHDPCIEWYKSDDEMLCMISAN